MDSEGPVVKAVLLKADGSCEEHDVNMTARARAVPKLLGSEVSFLGQWEDEGVIIMQRRDSPEGTPINQHKLQPPFHSAQVTPSL